MEEADRGNIENFQPRRIESRGGWRNGKIPSADACILSGGPGPDLFGFPGCLFGFYREFLKEAGISITNESIIV
jgi:hypothetical protein